MQKGESPALDDWIEDGDESLRELERWQKDTQTRNDSVMGSFKPINHLNANRATDTTSTHPLLSINPNMMTMRPFEQQTFPAFSDSGNFWAELQSGMAGQQQGMDSPGPMGGWTQQYGQITPPDDFSRLGMNPEKAFSQVAQAFPNVAKNITPTEELDHDQLNEKLGEAQTYAEGEDKTSTNSQPPMADDVPLQGPKSSRSKRPKQRKTRESDPKRQEFLARNRLAASKSRQKKKEWTTQLESKCRDLQAERSHLTFYIAGLKEEVIMLKTEMLKHSGCKCHGIRNYLEKSATSLSPAALASTSPSHLPLQSPTSEQPFLGRSSTSSDGLSREGSAPGIDCARLSLDLGNSPTSAVQSPMDAAFGTRLNMDESMAHDDGANLMSPDLPSSCGQHESDGADIADLWCDTINDND